MIAVWVVWASLLAIGAAAAGIALAALIERLWPLYPTERGGDGFRYWPPCPDCGNVAVSCKGRDPVDSGPARRYRMACDHGLDASGIDPEAAWPGSGFCGRVWWVTHGEIMAVQDQQRRWHARNLP